MNKKIKLRVLIWLTILTLTAGYTNILCLSYLGIPVTHHTGNITNLAINLSEQNFGAMTMIFASIVSFFSGCVAAGVIFYKKHIGFSKSFAVVTIGYCAFYLLVNFFVRKDMLLLVTTSFMVGIQNSLLARYKGITTRTTHMTGYITDAGVHLGRALRGNKNSFRVFLFFVIDIFNFFLGSLAGYYFISFFGFYSFMISGVLRIATSIFYLVFIYEKDVNEVVLKNG